MKLPLALNEGAGAPTAGDIETPELAIVAKILPTVENDYLVLASKKSVAEAILIWTKWRVRIMTNPLNKKELEHLLEAARAAGRAEGYAQARLEIALERVGTAGDTPKTQQTDEEPLFRDLKLEDVKIRTEKAEENEPYTTRTTVAMTKTIALDYLKSVAPRIVGPSEIIKNTKKTLNIFISFGTLKRAIEALVEAGQVEQMEPSRWKFKGAA